MYHSSLYHPTTKLYTRERGYFCRSDVFHWNSNDRYVFSSHFQLNVRTPQLNLYITRTRKLLTSKAEGEILCFFLHRITQTYSQYNEVLRPREFQVKYVVQYCKRICFCLSVSVFENHSKNDCCIPLRMYLLISVIQKCTKIKP